MASFFQIISPAFVGSEWRRGFLNLNWVFKLCLVYKIRNNLAPKYLSDYSSKISDTHNYCTRGSSTDYRPCRFKSCVGKYSFLYSAAVLWNGLPSNLKLLSSSYYKPIKIKRKEIEIEIERHVVVGIL